MLSVKRYDGNGDSLFETRVAPTVSVTGSQAQDVNAPVISFTAEEQPGGWQVGLSAVDEGSGVHDIYYSLDGTDFQVYTAAIAVARQTPVIHVFADDNVGNRSTRIITLAEMVNPVESHQVYLPMIVR